MLGVRYGALKSGFRHWFGIMGHIKIKIVYNGWRRVFSTYWYALNGYTYKELQRSWLIAVFCGLASEIGVMESKTLFFDKLNLSRQRILTLSCISMYISGLCPCWLGKSTQPHHPNTTYPLSLQIILDLYVGILFSR